MSFWDVPGVKAGVLSGSGAWGLLKHCREKHFALPAFSCSSTSTVNAVLEAGKELGRPVILQFSQENSAAFVGKSLPNEKGVLQASILGAVVAAHYVRNVAPAYGVPVLVQSERCVKGSLPWLDGMLEADESFFKAHGEPLFSGHALGLGEEAGDENIATSVKYLERMKGLDLVLETEAGKAGACADPQDVVAVYEALKPVGERFTIAPAFGNAPGVQKGLAPKLDLLASFQEKAGAEKPLFLVFRGGSGAEKKDLAAAVAAGVVKLDLDTDAQWAYWEGLLKFYKANEGHLQSKTGSPAGEKACNLAYFEPRRWLRECELGMATRAKEACGDLQNA